MDEYIKRSEILRLFTVAPDGTRYKEVDCDNFPVTVQLRTVKKMIREAPASKVREDITAEWEYDSDNLPICPNCGKVALQRLYFDADTRVSTCRFVLSRYCPNCGARMTDQRDAKKQIRHIGDGKRRRKL